MTAAQPLTGSMCTGYGGLDAGVNAAAGGQLAWAADSDPGASAVIACRMPGIPNLGDIRETSWETAPPVDILCAGFPCQSLSAAGKQKGTADERWLFPFITAAISRMPVRPRLLVFENVPRILTIEGGDVMAQITGSLAGLGYVGCWGIYSAAQAGAPHLRKRWFLAAADAQGVGRPARQPPVHRDRAAPGDQHTVPHPDAGLRHRRADQQIRDTEKREAAERDRSAAFPDPGSPRLQRDLTARAGHDPLRHGQAQDRTAGRPPVSSAGTGRRGAAAADPDGICEQQEHASAHHIQEERPPRRRGSVLATGTGGDSPDRCRPPGAAPAPGGNAAAQEQDDHGLISGWGLYEAAVRRWELVSGYPVPYPVEPGKNGNSRMTAEFPEWLMGLPPGWVTDVPGLSRSAKIRIIGNGVVPQQGYMAVMSLLGILREAGHL